MTVNAAIVVAGGRGQRMGAPGPKQYLDLGGRSVLAHAMEPFLRHPMVDWVQVVIHPDDAALYGEAVRPHPRILPPVHGGANRQDSVRAGLDALRELAPDNVLIHDAARPFLSQQTISAVLRAIADGVAALPASRVSDTMKRADSEFYVQETVSREGLFAAQTPQGFRYRDIVGAHGRAVADGLTNLTDDCGVAEHAGMPVVVVPAPSTNFKLTTQSDLEIARMLIGLPDVRTGNGYDVHRLVEGDHVWLCGIRIDHDRKLLGHSDADVGLHALTDAVLATIGDGDIGKHFPPSDPQWRGASSDRFLVHALRLVAEAGGRINHLDVTLICEAPRIGPHRDAMRGRIAEIAGTSIERVSVKATTNEGIGFIGRQEGIAAIATATIAFRSVPDTSAREL